PAPAPAKPAPAPAPAKPAAPAPAPAKPAAPAPAPAKPAAPAPAPAKPAAAAAAPASPKPLATPLVTPGPSLDAATDVQKKEAAAAMKSGKAALDAAKYEEALGFFRQSYSAVSSPNSRMLLARALTKLGRFSEAYREALATQVEANYAAQQNPKYRQTADGVRDDLAELERKLAFVTVKILGEPDEASLTIGGAPVDRTQWGRPIPVTPGRVAVVLTTPDGKATQTLDLLAGAKVSLPLEMPTSRVADAPVVAPPPRRKSTWTGPDRKKLGYISAGVGGVGMLAFGTFGALSNGQYSRLESGCPLKTNCDSALADVASRGKAYQAVANASLVLGVVGLAAGATFIVWDGLDGGGWPWSEAGIVNTRVAVGPGSLSLSGEF
ncbi:MAG: CDC27 family protein, partial [Deltaproteobacteria bacterium]|nr:CDC27 family protein [Deltaproteobacteria bacterium]